LVPARLARFSGNDRDFLPDDREARDRYFLNRLRFRFSGREKLICS
jgi:hypothetical protein